MNEIKINLREANAMKFNETKNMNLWQWKGKYNSLRNVDHIKGSLEIEAMTRIVMAREAFNGMEHLILQ